MKRLKVLFVIDSLGTGGAERDLAEMLPQLPRLDIVPVVVSLRRRREGVQREIQDQGFDVRFLDAGNFVPRIRALRRIIRAERPDVVHTVLFHSDLAGRLAAIGTRTKVLTSLVNTDYHPARLKEPNASAMRLSVARAIEGWSARVLTAHIHANSHAVKTAAVKDLRIPAEMVTVIEGGRGASRLEPPNGSIRRDVRNRFGCADDQEVLVTVGRQDYQKGQRYLLEAMAALASSHPGLVLLLAGRAGDASAGLEDLRDRLGLRERVRFLGHRDDVPDILTAADLFVFPSLYEGCPGAVIEAMAYGLPVVASRIEPVREIVEEGRNALLVEPASAVALAAGIERLLREGETADAFRRRSREIFEERFTLERTIARKVALYRRLTGVS